MDLYRFYVPALIPGDLALPEDQAHHARAVLRLEAGAAVELFDGRGATAPGTLSHVGKREVLICVGPVVQTPPPRFQLTLATAVPKADRAEWLIEQASQLNVACVQWLACDRGVVKPKEGGAKLDKWRRLAIESAKQCGRAYLLEVSPLLSLERLLERAVAQQDTLFWLEPREGTPALQAWRTFQEKTGGAGRLTALVGPEGGWSLREMELLAAHPGVVRVRLTPTVLRIETACAAIAAIVGMAD